MIKINSLSAAISATLLLAGCGGSSSSDSVPMANITAIDGYLSQAKIYKQNEDGQCLSNVEPLAVTNDQGQAAVILADLEAGFCVVADDSTIDMDHPEAPIAMGFTMYAPELSLLGQVDDTVISPFTSYLQEVLKDAKALDSAIGTEELQTTINQAKIDLLSAFDLESDNANISDLLTTDFIAAKTATNNTVQTAAHKLHRLAQVIVNITAQNQVIPTSEQTVNLAIVLEIELQDEDADLDKLATFLAPRIDELSDSNNIPELKGIVSDPVLMDQIPVISAEVASLSQQLTNAIEDADGDYDENLGLPLINLVLEGISIANNDIDNGITLQLKKSKIDSDWDAEVVASTNEEGTNFSNGMLSIDELIIKQSGDFVYRLTIDKQIDDNTYTSNVIAFNLNIAESVVPNQAPEYAGNEAEQSEALITLMDEAVNDVYAIFDPNDYDLEGDAELSLDSGFVELTELFSDAQQQTIEFVVVANAADFANISADEQPDLFCFDSLGCSLSTTVPVPSEGESSYRMQIWALDSIGAMSAKALDFTLTIDADKIRSVTFNYGSDDSGDNNSNYGTPFNGVMMKQSQLDAAGTQISMPLKGEEPDYEVSQMFAVKEYQCNNEDKCVETSTVIAMAGYTIEDNPYLIINNGFIVATDTAVSETTTVSLTPNFSGDNVKIYLVDAEQTIVEGGIENYGQQLSLELSPNGDVTISIDGYQL